VAKVRSTAWAHPAAKRRSGATDAPSIAVRTMACPFASAGAEGLSRHDGGKVAVTQL
jgi:hypothetical protein